MYLHILGYLAIVCSTLNFISCGLEVAKRILIFGTASATISNSLEKSTEVACKYLLKAKQKFGSWTLAAAAYNAGMNKISRELEKQKTDNYYDLLLNEETSRYVPRIISIKHILEHPEDFGFVFSKEDLYTPYDYYEVAVDSSITNWAEFAQQMNITYKELKLLNPWLRSDKLTNKKKKTYHIKILKK